MSEPGCGTCRFWKRLDADDLYLPEEPLVLDCGENGALPIIGDCRRFPPVRAGAVELRLAAERMRRTPGLAGDDMPNANRYFATKFPLTHADDWCGEYSPGETSPEGGAG
jgi:hypothetical protein